jgi:hypothetical protein
MVASIIRNKIYKESKDHFFSFYHFAIKKSKIHTSITRPVGQAASLRAPFPYVGQRDRLNVEYSKP